MLKHQRNLKKIKKECFKNMIAGPSYFDTQNLKVSKQSYSQKDSIISGPAKSAHKNSLVGLNYNSDNEDNKQSSDCQSRVKEEVNRGAKHWQQQFHRQSSHDDLNDL